MKRIVHRMIVLALLAWGFAACAPAAEPVASGLQVASPQPTSEPIESAIEIVPMDDTQRQTESAYVQEKRAAENADTSQATPASASPADRVNLEELAENRSETTEEEAVVMPAPGIPNSLAALQQRVREDLAEQLGVTIADVTVVEVKKVTWRDSSLGCPQPDQMYLMALTPGYRLQLLVNDVRYLYHTDSSEHFLQCPPEQAQEPLPPEQE